MKIANQSVVSIHYTLKNSEGEVLGSSEGKEPLDYLHGAGNIVPGLEKALLDKTEGDQLSVVVPPEEGYGERSDQLMQTLPMSAFDNVEQDVEVGMRFQAQTQEGTVSMLVKAVNDDSVEVDCNHPLAGEELHFDVTVTGVREASEQELTDGHA